MQLLNINCLHQLLEHLQIQCSSLKYLNQNYIHYSLRHTNYYFQFHPMEFLQFGEVRVDLLVKLDEVDKKHKCYSYYQYQILEEKE